MIKAIKFGLRYASLIDDIVDLSISARRVAKMGNLTTQRRAR